MIAKQRYIIGICTFCLILFVYSFKLYDLQIRNYSETQNQVTQTKPVKALRGDILDCNGTVLVGSKISHDISLSSSILSDQETLLQIIETLPPIYDSLPIEEEFPYAYRKQNDTFLSYLKHYNIKAPHNGADLLYQLAQVYHFNLDDSLVTTRQLVGLSYELDLRRLGLVSTPFIAAKDIDQTLFTALSANKLDGVTIHTNSKREYPYPIASHLLGYMGQIDESSLTQYLSQGYSMDSTIGKTGVEQRFEKILHGTDGLYAVNTSAEGIHISSEYVEKAVAGDHISLSISLPLQTACEEALASFISNSTHAKGGAIAIVNVHSGAVLSLASYPTYSLSSFSQDYNTLIENPNNPLFDRALQGTYAPGSTFKIITAIAALEKGIITEDTKILDTGKYTYYSYPQPQSYLYRTKGETLGPLNLSEAMAHSCNVYFYDVGRRVGIEAINYYAKQFGLGEPTGIELSQSAVGHIASPDTSNSLGQAWYEGNTLSASIGQENNLFSPLQLANYIAAVANGGTLYQSSILHRVWSYDYKTLLFEHYPVISSTTHLKPSTITAIKNAMLSVTQTETLAPVFKTLPFQIGAKTGSAQVGTHVESNAVFVCFAPFDDPEIAMAIVVEEGGAGSSLASLAKDILMIYADTCTQETEN